MGIAGGALIPLLYTALKDNGILSNQSAFLVCSLPCYLYIMYYAVKGFAVGKKNTGTKRPLRVAQEA